MILIILVKKLSKLHPRFDKISYIVRAEQSKFKASTLSLKGTFVESFWIIIFYKIYVLKKLGIIAENK